MRPALTQSFYHRWLAVFTGLLLCATSAPAADSGLAETAGTIRLWHAEDGLPSDSVTAVAQTQDGFLWVGTTAGLVWFDGVAFTKLPLTPALTNSPVYVTALCEDSFGHLWIGTQQSGVFQFAQGKLYHYGQAQGLVNDTVTSLAADHDGQVWIGSNWGLSRWTGRKFEVFTKRDGLLDESISGISVARSGAVWITTRVGMCRFINNHTVPYEFQTESQGRSPEYLGAYEDRRGNLWAFGDTYLINLAEGKRFNYFRSSESASLRIWSLCEGAGGRLWIGTSGRGLFCFEDNRFQPVILGGNRWPYDVRAICEDREGNLWLGTFGGGLVQLRLQSVQVLRGEQGLPEIVPTALALDADGRVYVGLQRGGVWMGEAGRFDQLGGVVGLQLQHCISALGVAHDGTVWAGTAADGVYGLRNGRGVHLTTADGLADNRVLAVGLDAEDAVWVSTVEGTLHRLTGNRATRFDTRQGLPKSPVTVMAPAAAGGLWLGTQSGRILRAEHEQFTELPAPAGLTNQLIIALHEGEAGRLWIGTFGSGLSCLANGVGMTWTTSNGLPSDVVAGVVEDAAKNLWLATGAGIYRVNHFDVRKALNNSQLPLACKLVSPAKTVPEASLAMGGRRALLAPDEHLWFATSEGVLNVDTHQSEITPAGFPLYILSTTVNGQPPVSRLRGTLWSPSATPEPLRASADVPLEIHFTAMSFAAPEDLRFRHQLVGVDPDWVDDAGARFARYVRLPYGDYRFRVAARNGDGVWQEAAEPLMIVVPTPLYYQRWAIGLYVILAVTLVTGIVRMISHRRLRVTLARLEQQQSLERERMRIARDMHDEMGSKLTKISFLSERVQMDAGARGPLAEKIQSIAQAARELLKTMDEIVWVVNPRNDTLGNLVAYLSHYAVEYFQDTPVECELRLPPDVPHHTLASEARHNLFLAFEEALNNVLKHAAATSVVVTMSVNPSELELVVADNGKGCPPAGAPAGAAPARAGRVGNGMKNMRQRLAAVGGECLVAMRPGAGTTVTLRFRLTPPPASRQ
jgi:ligand-binding sensor domain-containing protein/signal transduction histidine kinase